MVTFKVTNNKTGKSFTVQDSCIFVAHDKVDEGIKKRKWKKSDCLVI